MKTSFFVLWLSMLCIVILTTCTVTAHVTMVDSQLATHVVEDKVVTSADTCNCVDCESRIIDTQGFLTLDTVRCEYGKSPLITKITMDISSITPKKFSYYVVDERNLNLAKSGKPFIYDPNRSKMNNQNCTTDSVISRYRTPRSVIVKVEDLVEGEDLVDIYYDIQTTCGPVPANSMEINTATEYNSKHYIGSTVRLDVTFYNSELDSVDTLLKGTIQVKGSKIQQGDVKKGRSRLYLTLLDEFFEADSILVEFVQNPKLNQNIRLPLVKKGAKGEILVHKNQQIYSGKEFTLYFQLFDSDNGVTPTIDIPSLSIASPNNNLYCQVTNYLNGYGFATCENIDTPGEHSLVLKYNGAVLHEKTIAVQENPYQYINEAIVLLLVILVIVSLLILCVGVVSFIIFYKKLNKGNGKNTPNRPQGRFIREEDAEELDNM